MRFRLFGLAGLAWLATGCGASLPPPSNLPKAEASSPLGKSFVLIPAPSEDDSLLGRVLVKLPDDGQTLEDVSEPNPCLQSLEPSHASGMVNSFDDAQELAVNGSARAMLGSFGFHGDLARATHFVYRLSTDRRLSRNDTIDYKQCCAGKRCGIGYVSALIHGNGEYASGAGTSASAGVDVAFAGADGAIGIKLLQKRHVRGWVAALVKLDDPAGADRLSPMGAAIAGVNEEGLGSEVGHLYSDSKVDIVLRKPAEGDTTRVTYAFHDSKGDITENEFVRRYRKTTGSPEIDRVERRRNWEYLWLFPAITGLAAVPTGLACGGFAHAFTDQAFSNRGSFLGSAACGTGVVSSYFFLAMTPVMFFSDYDGAPTDHALSEYDARLYAGRYNRVLLRKAARDAIRMRKSESRVVPFVGHDEVGVVGTF